MAARKQEDPKPTAHAGTSPERPLCFCFSTHGSNGGETRKRAKRKTLWRHQWEWRSRDDRWWQSELTGGVTLGAPCSESSPAGMTLPHIGSRIQWVMDARNQTLKHTEVYPRAWLIFMPPDTCTPCKCVASRVNTQLHSCSWRKKSWMRIRVAKLHTCVCNFMQHILY